MTQIEPAHQDHHTTPVEQAPGVDISPEQFRRQAVTRWSNGSPTTWSASRRCPSSLRLTPGETLARLPNSAPEEPEPFEALLADLDEIVLPGITHWQSPGWFAYFPANASPPSVLGELAAAGLGCQGMLWATSPACTEIEMRVLDWLVELLGLPESWKHSVGPGGGVIQTSASDSTHLAHVIARHARDGARRRRR